jgi:Glycosidases
VRAFRDSNATAGGLKAVTEKVGLLSYLAVDTIWLLPISPSPLRDDGYDVSDYCGIHPMYGNMQDFQELIAQAHQRALKILVEFGTQSHLRPARLVPGLT